MFFTTQIRDQVSTSPSILDLHLRLWTVSCFHFGKKPDEDCPCKFSEGGHSSQPRPTCTVSPNCDLFVSELTVHCGSLVLHLHTTVTQFPHANTLYCQCTMSKWSLAQRNSNQVWGQLTSGVILWHILGIHHHGSSFPFVIETHGV